MAEENVSDGFTKRRKVLGDLTNLLGKRGSSGTENIGVKSLSFRDKDSSKRIHVSCAPQSEMHSPKGNVLSSIPNSTDKNTNAEGNQFGCESVSKISSNVETEINNDGLLNVNLPAGENFEGPNSTDLKGEKVMMSSTAATEVNVIPEICQSEFVGLKVNVKDLQINESGQAVPGSSKESKGNVVENAGFKTDDELHDSLKAAAEMGGFCLDNDSGFDDYESKGSQSDGDGQNLLLSQCGSVDCANFLPESQESTVFGIEKFMEMESGNEKCVCEGTEPTRSCSCSFCTKAGYMWLDLNYQDIKARVSALKKSQKEARILAEGIIRSKNIERHGAESFTRSSTLESDLMYQWVSLFQHMAGVMEEESNQLEGRLLPLNDLREKYKRDLESIGDERSEKQ
ncbi:ATP-citrate lyase A-1 [Striga asiatica]|uniref:ATP-citrate lyase A-1 n=1 Tax=Striga asiatica TaxID=4170 RepID=A0A5A7QQX5_STRAF|nr:ATP-citrate lyase A-1 [Striga asiatica]